MKTNKLLVTLLVTVMLLSMATGCGETSENEEKDTVTTSEKMKIAFVSDQALDASEWLINLVAGVSEYQKAHDNVEIKMIEATQANEYEPKIRALADAGYDVIVTTYASTAEATISVSMDYPNVIFGSLDGTIDNIKQYSNIQEFGLNRTETAYLAGVVAAATSEKGVVGIVAGMDEPVINAIIAGWQQGLRSVNPDIIDYVSYAGTWTDPTTGKDLGLSLVDKGCDVIAAAAGGTGAGTAQAAAESQTYFVAWDSHYDEVFSSSKVELGSALNYFDVMVIQFIEDVMNDNFNGGQRVDYGMKQGVCEFHMYEDAPVSEKSRTAVKEALNKIENGELEISTVPLHK